MSIGASDFQRVAKVIWSETMSQLSGQPFAQGDSGISCLRQHYHFNFGRLLQNLHRRCKKSPHGHDLTLVAVTEAILKIRLCQRGTLRGRSEYNSGLSAKIAEIAA